MNKRIITIGALVLLILILILCLIFLRPAKYTITFDSNGGLEVSSQEIRKGEKISKPEDPTREGYIFAGWYYNDELFDFDTEVKENITLTAYWEEVGDAEVTGVTLSTQELILAPQGTAILTAVVEPDNAKDKTVLWSSSNTNIVTVDEDGTLKALKEGKATITVKTKEGEYTATCKVTVTKDVVAVEGVSISGASEVNIGSSIKLTATVKPDDASNKDITWSSSNKNVATVDKNGNVKGLRAGTVTITVTTVDGEHKATHTVVVKKSQDQTTPTNPQPANPQPTNPQPTNPQPTDSQPTNPQPTNPQPSTPEVVSVISVNISGADTVEEGKSITLTADINPGNATNKNVTWSITSGSDCAKISTSGNKATITGVKAGTVVITVRTEDGGKTATKQIVVKEKPASYEVTLTPEKTVTGIFQYQITSITKNGSPLEFKYIALGNTRVYPTNKTIPSHLLNDGKLTTLTIVLNDKDETRVTANIHYNT